MRFSRRMKMTKRYAIKVNYLKHTESLKMVKLKAFTIVEKNQFIGFTFKVRPIIINLGGRSLPF